MWIASISLLVIAALDWGIYRNVSLGPLYVVPVMLAAPHLSSLALIILSVICTLFREAFLPEPWSRFYEWRLVVGFGAFLAAGLLVRELVKQRMLAEDRLEKLNESIRLQHRTEQQLRNVIDTSPAAIVTIDEQGNVLLANQAADELFGYGTGALTGQRADKLLLFLSEVLDTQNSAQRFRATTQTRCRRRNGETFLAHVWFATFETGTGRQAAAIVADASGDFREREEATLHQVLQTTRVLVGAVAHEIRNLCAGIGLVHSNLGRVTALSDSEDYRALGSLTEGLSRLANQALAQTPQGQAAPVDLVRLVEELKLILTPEAEDHDTKLEWHCPFERILVWGDRPAMLQAMLNLAMNSLRAMERGTRERVLSLDVSRNNAKVRLCFTDTGPGVADPENLFRPFQAGADKVGLGLYISRAMVRLNSGDIRFVPDPERCRFEMEFLEAEPGNGEANQG